MSKNPEYLRQVKLQEDRELQAAKNDLSRLGTDYKLMRQKRNGEQLLRIVLRSTGGSLFSKKWKEVK